MEEPCASSSRPYLLLTLVLTGCASGGSPGGQRRNPNVITNAELRQTDSEGLTAFQAVILGVVSDAATGEIVDAAAVTLVGTGIETRTAADGIFEFPDAPLGPVTIRVEAPGYPAVVEEVEMTPGTVRIMQVILPSVEAVLRDILAAPATGDARSAADLLARKALGTTATFGSGRFVSSTYNYIQGHWESEGKFGVDIKGAAPFWRAALAQDPEATKALAATYGNL